MICPTCQQEMRIVSLIDERDVIEKMLKCLGLWEQGVRVEPNCHTGTDPPPGDWVYEPVDQDPFPDYDTEPVLFVSVRRTACHARTLSRGGFQFWLGSTASGCSVIHWSGSRASS
jgi:hypothetical protein